MSDAEQQQTTLPVEPSPEKPTDDWVTGDEPMTGPQRSYLETLAREAGEPVPPLDLTKAHASDEIERLQHVTGRGASTTSPHHQPTREQQLPLDDVADDDPLAETSVIVPDQATG